MSHYFTPICFEAQLAKVDRDLTNVKGDKFIICTNENQMVAVHTSLLLFGWNIFSSKSKGSI